MSENLKIIKKIVYTLLDSKTENELVVNNNNFNNLNPVSTSFINLI